MTQMTKEYLKNTLKEERLWKEGESDSFDYGNWSLTLRKEEKEYHSFFYSVNGVNKNGSSISRRYTNMNKAFLHIVNDFNETANIKNRYQNIEDYIISK